ncbi:MAG: hypothetical protein DRG11_05680 [Epsilonproteobacteria bacterium]|nr:MAG: hypothetical protein B1H07_04600 [Campylobacteraceae bacterium 4484_166]RLA74190.1 MAG: hypothetical protein DRG11_05680 [Campylobacterota bacterium]
MSLENLRDIKDFEYLAISWHIYLTIGSIVLLFLITIVAIVLYKKRKKKTQNIIQKATTLLKHLSFDADDKKLIYSFTIYSKIISNKQDENLNSILKLLQPYKYKKQNLKLSEDIKTKMKKYIMSVS